MNVHAQSIIDLISRPFHAASIDRTEALIAIQELETAVADVPEYGEPDQAVTHIFQTAHKQIWNVRN